MIRLVHSSTKLKAYTISVRVSVQCLPECVVRECGQVWMYGFVPKFCTFGSWECVLVCFCLQNGCAAVTAVKRSNSSSSSSSDCSIKGKSKRARVWSSFASAKLCPCSSSYQLQMPPVRNEIFSQTWNLLNLIYTHTHTHTHTRAPSTHRHSLRQLYNTRYHHGENWKGSNSVLLRAFSNPFESGVRPYKCTHSTVKLYVLQQLFPFVFVFKCVYVIPA